MSLKAGLKGPQFLVCHPKTITKETGKEKIGEEMRVKKSKGKEGEERKGKERRGEVMVG